MYRWLYLSKLHHAGTLAADAESISAEVMMNNAVMYQWPTKICTISRYIPVYDSVYIGSKLHHADTLAADAESTSAEAMMNNAVIYQ